MNYKTDHMLAKETASSKLSKRFAGFNSRGFDPLLPSSFLDVQVSGQKDGKVVLSVVLPADMIRSFVTFLESMSSLMCHADRLEEKANRETRPVDLDELAQADQLRADFEKRVCVLFHKQLNQGHDPKEAIKRTNKALKAENHPWATYETVKSTLSSCGELRRASQPVRKETPTRERTEGS